MKNINSQRRRRTNLSAAIRVSALSLLAALTVCSAVSCSGFGQSGGSALSDGKIAALESKVAALQAGNLRLESELGGEIAALESELDALRGEMSKLPAAPDTKPEEGLEYFGFKYIIEDGAAVITAYAGSSSELIVPASIGGAPVVEIADSAFEKSGITSVSVPETVRKIGWFAFRDCLALERAVIPKTVSEIGYDAFSGCASLTVYAPESSYAYKYAKSYGIGVSAE